MTEDRKYNQLIEKYQLTIPAVMGWWGFLTINPLINAINGRKDNQSTESTINNKYMQLMTD